MGAERASELAPGRRSGNRHRPAVSVIIPTYNRIDTLERALGHLAAQTVGPDAFEVIVADDGSTDDTGTRLGLGCWPFALTYRRQANAGPAAARNLALREVQAPLTLIINDDTLLAPDAVERHLALHERFAGEHVMVLGSFELMEPFVSTRLGQLLTHTPALFQFCMLAPGDRADHNFAYTCNLSLPTDAARRVGFDENFRGPAGEDIAFGRELGKLGWAVHYDPSIGGRHDHEMSVRSLARTSRTRGRGQATYYRKYGVPASVLETLRKVLPHVDTLDEQAEPVLRRLERQLEDVPYSAADPVPEETYRNFGRVMSMYDAAGQLDDPILRRKVAA